MPTLVALNACTAAEFAAGLDGVLEHSADLVAAVADQRPFASADALHAALLAQVSALRPAALIAFLQRHPELAGSAARAGAMTPESIAEQGTSRLDGLAAEARALWDRLNAEYRSKFGFPFILCIRRYTQAAAAQEFARRLTRARTEEIAANVNEIGRISRLRLAALIADHRMHGVAGRLTVRLYDERDGSPLGGIPVECRALGEDVAHRAETVVGADGQARAVLIDGVPLRIGRHELLIGADTAAPVEIEEPEAHYAITAGIGPTGASIAVTTSPCFPQHESPPQ